MTSLVTAGARSRAFMTPYAFLLPALVVTAAVILFPVLQTAWMSLHDFVLFRPRDVPFIGLGNFERMWNDEVFWISLGHSFLWIALVVGFQFLLGLGAALLLNQSFWWRGLARSLVVVPWALPSVIIGLMWTWMYDFNVGVINDGLIRLGLISEPVAWLARPDTAFYAVIVALIWQGFPFFAVVVLAGLQTIPAELYEAAEIDGASRFQKLVYVTLPSISEVIATALLLRTIWVANSLDVILVMTGGGPGYATHTLPLYAFLKAYSGMEFGYGAALALVLTALLLVVVFVYVRRVAREIGR
ncbi:carbohydrate ABC transporter permease [Chelatococcus composti]|uniref:Multiple sugar transport system permease protein n=1 Tax=Chelatococcus composti TaxID=1743235 RepID=A0A841KEY8_9HYPH|nr:sugar ABC transporter permease [Chelatococcus composti]MBB6169544.1 multiple sugar transport system permease protein [Chelatococcus composti]MBS7736129.1 sugar ABC transporter permease [Chelatococcus composti]GGG48538.1 sugar ABC transporter permease [Chelatococcus composti]